MEDLKQVIKGYKRTRFANSVSNTLNTIGAFNVVDTNNLVSTELTGDQLKAISLPLITPPKSQWSSQPSTLQPYFATELATIQAGTSSANLKVERIGEASYRVYRSYFSLGYGGYEFGIIYTPIISYTTDVPRNYTQFNPHGIYTLASIDVRIEDEIIDYNYATALDGLGSSDSLDGLYNTQYPGISPDNDDPTERYWLRRFINPSMNTDLPIKRLPNPTIEIKDSYQQMRGFVAFQSFAPEVIPVNFRAYASAYYITQGLIEDTATKARITSYYIQPAEITSAKNDRDYWIEKSFSRWVFYNQDFTNPAGFTVDWTFGNYQNYISPIQTFTNARQVGGISLSPIFPSGASSRMSRTYFKWFHVEVITITKTAKDYPNYSHLLTGYKPLDTRDIAESITFTSPITGKCKIGYYQSDLSEGATSYGVTDTRYPKAKNITRLKTINWVSFELDLTVGKQVTLDLSYLVLGTLHCSNSSVMGAILSGVIPSGNYYPISVMAHDSTAIASLFTAWIALWSASDLDESDATPSDWNSLITLRSTKRIAQTVYSKILTASSNPWSNAPIGNNNFAPTADNEYHPMLTDNQIGVFNLNSPQLIDISTALAASKYSRNELNPNSPRVTNLGYLTNRIAEVLGIRLDANGEINKQNEKGKTRRLLKEKEKLDNKKYDGNSFASDGMVVRRLTNYFDRKYIKSGGTVAIHDLPQLMLEILDQINLGIGLQESGAIEIKNGNNTHRYPNLLALVTEIAIHQFNQSDYAKQTHISSLVTQEQTKELIGGLGLPTVSKNIIREVNGKKAGIPYWGIAPQASLAKKIDTCTYNVGIVLGQLL